MEQIAIPTSNSNLPKTDLPKKPSAREQLFVGTFISLSWQMLVVVLVPAIGGHFLDERMRTAPLFTIVGFTLAITMAALLTYRAYKTMQDDYKERVSK